MHRIGTLHVFGGCKKNFFFKLDITTQEEEQKCTEFPSGCLFAWLCMCMNVSDIFFFILLAPEKCLTCFNQGGQLAEYLIKCSVTNHLSDPGKPAS